MIYEVKSTWIHKIIQMFIDLNRVIRVNNKTYKSGSIKVKIGMMVSIFETNVLSQDHQPLMLCSLHDRCDVVH